MRFQISRTRQRYNEDYDKVLSPCEGAYEADYMQVDTRSVDDPAKLGFNGKDTWYTEGSNHRVVNGQIKRDTPARGWFIDISSLEELLEFTKKNEHSIVMSYSHWDSDLPSIEIYDDYRE